MITEEIASHVFPDNPTPFAPAPWARSPHLQSIFASLRLRALGKNEMVDNARKIILDGGGGVRLLAFHSAQRRKKPKAFVLLIHGWEGSSDSTYMLHTGRYLYRLGCDIARLNLRDHGDSHHLNEGMFNGTLIAETATAVGNAAGLAPDLPFFIVGFSLGGNFALRLALSRNGSPIGRLCHVVCVSPLINPYRSTVLIDKLPLYRHHFLHKWKRSLRRKQKLFPQLYQFDDLLHLNNTMALTERLINRYTEFDGCRDYFNHYTLETKTFHDLAVPVTVVAAEDDPVIPAG
ncbi:MAG TPA: alpha/beta fold hydrolase, partial [Deltaproteobacteria bacterium]|nr:alpha/beta fold hydrolase [Deltaproteobacteria bacterium]